MREIPFLIFNSLFASIRPPTGTLHVKEFEPMTVTVTVVSSPMSHSRSPKGASSVFLNFGGNDGHIDTRIGKVEI